MLIHICFQDPKFNPAIQSLGCDFIVPSPDNKNASKEINLLEDSDDQPYAMKDGSQVHVRLSSSPLDMSIAQHVCLGNIWSVGGNMLKCPEGTGTGGQPNGEPTSGGDGEEMEART